MKDRILGYDVARFFAILTVFFAHILLYQTNNNVIFVSLASLSPGITMSLLGFISAALLSKTTDFMTNYPYFIFRRLTRIYIPLFICLSFAVGLSLYLGLTVIRDHLIFHFLGFSLFFDLLQTPNAVAVGSGLWFVTSIIIMYFTLPLLNIVFRHKNSLLHFLVIYALCVTLNILLPRDSSFWNIAISFSLGVYLNATGKLETVLNKKLSFVLPLVAVTLLLCVLSTAKILPFDIRRLLFPVYPIAFMPIFFFIAKHISPWLGMLIKRFCAYSYEFYILHFYFINQSIKRLIGTNFNLLQEIIISLVCTAVIAYVISRIANDLRKMVEGYFLRNFGLTDGTRKS